MRWIALSLLVANLLYLGWELDRDARALVIHSPQELPAAVMTLQKLDEATHPPALKRRYGWQLPEQALQPER